ncbi:MAG: hypothetical protein WDW36_009080 [Sanguina aurantia]
MVALQCAVTLLTAGQAVAIPTETVYGLAANALSAEAVARIFQAKQRPSDNPLIIHVSSMEMLQALYPAGWELPAVYTQAVAELWPGPLTILLPCSPLIPPIVTCGHPTMAVRMPSHPVARALIAACGFPLAAPSANSSGRPSPTLATHVMEDLCGRIPLVLDGGPCGCGVESTVLDGLRRPPVLLRPGGVTAERLSRVPGLEQLQVYRRDFVDAALEAAPTTPGMKYRHYSPDAQVVLIDPRAWRRRMLGARLRPPPQQPQPGSNPPTPTPPPAASVPSSAPSRSSPAPLTATHSSSSSSGGSSSSSSSGSSGSSGGSSAGVASIHDATASPDRHGSSRAPGGAQLQATSAAEWASLRAEMQRALASVLQGLRQSGVACVGVLRSSLPDGTRPSGLRPPAPNSAGNGTPAPSASGVERGVAAPEGEASGGATSAGGARERVSTVHGASATEAREPAGGVSAGSGVACDGGGGGGGGDAGPVGSWVVHEYVLGGLEEPGKVARELFAGLRCLDQLRCEVIVVEGVCDADEGLAVMNRLRKAASRCVELG